MTNIEMDVARSTIRMNKAVASHLEEIDWEQRRYEIAKEMMPMCLQNATMVILNGGKLPYPFGKTIATDAIGFADALIKELKGE